MMDMILRKASAFLVSVGLVAFAIAALTLTASVRADDPLDPIGVMVPVMAACTGCPNGGPCGNPAPACTCQPTLTTGCVCQ